MFLAFANGIIFFDIRFLSEVIYFLEHVFYSPRDLNKETILSFKSPLTNTKIRYLFQFQKLKVFSEKNIQEVQKTLNTIFLLARD